MRDRRWSRDRRRRAGAARTYRARRQPHESRRRAVMHLQRPGPRLHSLRVLAGPARPSGRQAFEHGTLGDRLHGVLVIGRACALRRLLGCVRHGDDVAVHLVAGRYGGTPRVDCRRRAGGAVACLLGGRRPDVRRFGAGYRRRSRAGAGLDGGHARGNYCAGDGMTWWTPRQVIPHQQSARTKVSMCGTDVLVLQLVGETLTCGQLAPHRGSRK